MTTTTASSTNISGRKIRVIGVPLDLGQSRRGVDMGPSALRYADLNEKLQALGHDLQDLGDLDVIIPEIRHFGDPKAKYLKEIVDATSDRRDVNAAPVALQRRVRLMAVQAARMCQHAGNPRPGREALRLARLRPAIAAEKDP